MATGRTKVKGTGIRSTVAFVDGYFGAGTVEGLMHDAPRELREVGARVLPSEWYPAEYLGHVYSGIARAKVTGRAEQESFFDDLGRFIANDNLNSVYRFVLSMMSPDRVLGMTPRLWGTYFEGIEVTVVPVEERLGRVELRGLDAVPYVAPIACGWLTLAYELCGARSARVTEEHWNQGRASASQLVFEHRWA